MSKSNRLVTAGVFAASTLALVGATYLEAIPARAAASVEATSEPAGSTAATAAVAAPSAALDRAPEIPAPLAVAAGTSPRASAVPLSLPDFKGQRLSRARREGRRLGLVILARDDEGERVPVEMAPYYRVRRQLTPAGAAVEPGATVELRVREAETPEGY
jgi:hypothetical protein